MKVSIISLVLILFTNFSYAKSPAPLQVNGAVTVNTVQAKALMNQGVTFIDVRRESDFSKQHIAWAIHLDLKLALTERALLDVLRKTQPVVFYCNGDLCQRSAIASEKAVQWGWKKVFYYRGGFPDWKESGLPLE
jgi:rhodanese-related sulfurtransferase